MFIFSPFQLMLSEGHSLAVCYNGPNSTQYSSLVHMPLRPSNDYYLLGDVVSNGQSLMGIIKSCSC